MKISRFVNGALTSSSPPRGRFWHSLLPFILRSRAFPLVDIWVLDPHCPSNLLPATDTLTPIGSSEPTHKTLLGALRSHSSNFLGKFTLPRGQSHVTPAPMIDRGNCPAASRERERDRGRGVDISVVSPRQGPVPWIMKSCQAESEDLRPGTILTR